MEIALTVVSYGGGQDTTYFVHRICNDPAFRKKHIAGDLIIVGSDTGDEHAHTYDTILKVAAMCERAGIEFHWVSPRAGYAFHSKKWLSLMDQYNRNKACGSAAFKQTCTDNLKVKVVDNFVENWIKLTHGYEGNRKAAYYDYFKNIGGIRLILGFAAGEESRIKNGNKFDAVWKKKTVERYYPLIVDGTTRQNCIDYLEQMDWVVFPSNCMRCFYSSDQEILWLWRFHPSAFAEWVQVEENKINKYINAGHEGKNFGVYGKITLLQKLDKAQRLYGHWSDEQLTEYKYSHGHCIKSSY